MVTSDNHAFGAAIFAALCSELRGKTNIELCPSVSMQLDDKEKSIVCFSAGQTIYFDKVRADIFQAFRQIRRGSSLNDLDSILGPKDASAMVSALALKNLIRISPINSHRYSKHDRTAQYYSGFVEHPSVALDKINQACVVVIGLGAIGCEVITHLLSAGVQKYVCIDPDIVDITNLNRQLCFTPSHIGQTKVSVIERYILDREPNAQIRTNATLIDSPKTLQLVLDGLKPTVVACCADSVPGQLELAVIDYCLIDSIACTFAGAHIGRAYWGPLLVDPTTAIRAREFFQKVQSNAVVEHPVTGSFSCDNSVIGALLAKDLLFHLGEIAAPLSENRLQLFNFTTGQTTTLLEF